jgi:protein-tyrosine-phosphatase
MGVGGILHVCTANQIRSPMAELMMVDGLRRRFGDAAESVLVMSAGIRAMAGQPMQPRAIDELTRRGISSDAFRSTPLDLGVVGHAHLVLTATRSQRDELVASVPGALNKTFTWRELAWLLRDVRPGVADPVAIGHQLVGVVETGVARGVSSAFILDALQRNEHGHLWSIDLPPKTRDWGDQTGVAVALDVVRGAARRKLSTVLAGCGPVGTFVHDGLHKAENMLFEMHAVWPHLEPGGLIVADRR